MTLKHLFCLKLGLTRVHRVFTDTRGNGKKKKKDIFYPQMSTSKGYPEPGIH